MTLNLIMAVILRYFTECGTLRANYVKVVEGSLILSATKMQTKESNFRQYMIYHDIFRDKIEKECIKERNLVLDSEKFYCATLRGHLSNG